MAANNLDPTPTPIDGQIPPSYGTTDVQPHIPASAVLDASDQGLPTVGNVTFSDNDLVGLTTIYIPLDCTGTTRIITDFGYVLLLQDTAEDTAIDASLFLGKDSEGRSDPNAKKGTLVATINKTMPRPKLRVTILTKKTVPPPNPIA